MLSKRGHIPTMLLFIEGLVLMLAAWFVFLSVSGKIETQSASFAYVTQQADFERQYLETLLPRLINEALHEPIGSELEVIMRARLTKLAGQVDEVSDVPGNFFGKLRNGEYTIKIGEDGVYTLLIEGVTLEVRSGKDDVNVIKQNFTMAVRFISSGTVK